MTKRFTFLILTGLSIGLLSVHSLNGQIKANHSIVGDYIHIPAQYIDSVKKMWLVIAGESHSAAYRDGLSSLEGSNATYAVNVKESGTPDAYTTSNLRASRGTWGDVSIETGWIYSYGEEDWFTSATAISRTKAGITYCNSNNLTISAFGLGWCWDNGITESNMIDYLNATKDYMNYCKTNNIKTKIIFTTGPVDGYSGQDAYNNYLRWKKVRDYMDTIPSAILFDYADILCWDDNGAQTTTTYNNVTFSTISPNSLDGSGTGHIGMNGAIRIAKAMWWMLARIAGWDGKTNSTGISSDVDVTPNEKVILHQNFPNPFTSVTSITYELQSPGHVTLKVFDIMGKEVATIVNEDQSEGDRTVTFNAEMLSNGIYYYRISVGSFTATKKFMLSK
jgi:hypothetical protein